MLKVYFYHPGSIKMRSFDEYSKINSEITRLQIELAKQKSLLNEKLPRMWVDEFQIIFKKSDMNNNPLFQITERATGEIKFQIIMEPYHLESLVRMSNEYLKHINFRQI